MSNVYSKLATVRCNLQSLNLKKSGKNHFANFNYYQLDDFIPALNKLCLENGITTMFCINQDGLATLTVIDIDNSEDRITFTSPIASADIKGSTPIQCLGGVHTYMKRYLYQNAFEIVEPDMLDALVGKGVFVNNAQAEESKKREEKKIIVSDKATPEQIAIIKGFEPRFIEHAITKYKLKSIEDISFNDADYIIKKVLEKENK